jgi:hypothetical protein
MVGFQFTSPPVHSQVASLPQSHSYSKPHTLYNPAKYFTMLSSTFLSLLASSAALLSSVLAQTKGDCAIVSNVTVVAGDSLYVFSPTSSSPFLPVFWLLDASRLPNTSILSLETRQRLLCNPLVCPSKHLLIRTGALSQQKPA